MSGQPPSSNLAVGAAAPRSRALWRLFYTLRDAREGVARNPLAAAAIVLIIAFAVTVAGGVWLSERGTTALAGLLEEQAKLRVFLDPSADATKLADQARALPGVRTVDFVSKAETLARMNRAFSGQVDLGKAFAQNPFADSLDVEVRNAAGVEAVVQKLQGLPGVDEVVYGQNYVGPMLNFAASLRLAGSLAVAGVSLIALLVGVVTWQLALLSRLAEVRIKVLMGVRKRSVLAQFALEGVLLGLLGGLLAALGSVYGAGVAVKSVLSALPFTDAGAPPFGLMVVGSLALGLVLGGLGSLVAAGRVLRGVA
ncbi:MAG TPA: permease-like cell division protein FtsX [Limnochordia bacterium]|nr:permease-like cell division protein FtsX [Limnochordia bacterium]